MMHHRLTSPQPAVGGRRRKLVGEFVGAGFVPATVRGQGRACPTPSNIPMLPEGQPHAEHHLGSAEDPHPLRLLDKPPPDPAGALGAYDPQARMLLWGQ